MMLQCDVNNGFVIFVNIQMGDDGSKWYFETITTNYSFLLALNSRVGLTQALEEK